MKNKFLLLGLLLVAVLLIGCKNEPVEKSDPLEDKIHERMMMMDYMERSYRFSNIFYKDKTFSYVEKSVDSMIAERRNQLPKPPKE